MSEDWGDPGGPAVMAPVYMIGFTPHGACRGELRCSWPEGTAEFYDLTGTLRSATRDLVGRGWSIAQFVRFECGIATRQCVSVSFACDNEADVNTIDRIAREEFPALVPDWRHPRGRSTVGPWVVP